GKTVLVLTESRSLAGVLRPIASKYRIQIASTNGQVGGFLHTRIAPMLQNAFMNAFTHVTSLPQVLYFVDYDLAGGQIEANTRSVLEQKIDVLFEGNWKRIALTEQQVKEYKLPRIVKFDRRYKDGRPHEAVETEALSQRLIMQLLETELSNLL